VHCAENKIKTEMKTSLRNKSLPNTKPQEMTGLRFSGAFCVPFVVCTRANPKRQQHFVILFSHHFQTQTVLLNIKSARF
jgi:hypothetical protein